MELSCVRRKMLCFAHFALLVSVLLSLVVILSCGRIEDPARSNPLDPANPETHGNPFYLVASWIDPPDAVYLSWQAVSVSGVVCYRVLRQVIESSEIAVQDSVVALADVNDTYYWDLSIIGGTTYLYKIAALDSDSRASVCATQPGIEIVIPARGTIIIVQEPGDIADAGWSLTGPLNQSGSGGQILENSPVGSYDLTWLPVFGYTTPISDSQLLRSDDTITFYGTYLQHTGTIEIIQWPGDLVGASWSLSGSQQESGSGSHTLIGMPVGTYELIWERVDGYAAPISDTQVLALDETITFSGVYSTPAGSIVAWGRENDGQCDVPEPNMNFYSLAGGGFHSLGLKTDGTIVAWGSNYHGQCNVPGTDALFVAVAGGNHFSLGLKIDGTIEAWGDNDRGQCDIPTPNADFVAIAGGYYHGLGLKSDGAIVAWGCNDEGQCNVPTPNAGFVAVAAGAIHSLALRSDGTIVAWGNNDEGQCNVPLPNAGFVAISGGWWHSLGLKSDGSIVAWGLNWFGQCNIPTPNADFIAVAAGAFHSLALKHDGITMAWGQNADDYGGYIGQCDIPEPNINFVSIAGGYAHSLGIRIE